MATIVLYVSPDINGAMRGVKKLGSTLPHVMFGRPKIMLKLTASTQYVFLQPTAPPNSGDMQVARTLEHCSGFILKRPM